MSISKEQIFAICDQIFAEGQKVTNERVRTQLGSGSFSTISKAIRDWKEQNQADIIPDLSQTDIPEEAMPHLKRLYAVAQSFAQQAEVQEQVKVLEAENERLRSTLEELQGASAELSGIRYAYTEAQKRLEELARENENLNQGISPDAASIVEELRQQVSEKEERIAALEQNVADYSNQVKEYEQNLGNLSNQVETLTSEKTSLETEARDARVELNALKPEHEQAKGQLSDLKAENERLLTENTRLKAKASEESRLIQVDEPDTSRLQQELQAQREEIASLKVANESLTQELYLAKLPTGTGQTDSVADESEEEQVSLSAAALAKRLGVSASTITRHAANDNFITWSREKDPENKGWVKESGRFIAKG